MNMLSVISVLLGIISVVITLKYVKYYDSFEKHLHKLSLKSIDKNTIFTGLIKIQDELNLTDVELNNLLYKNGKAITKILKEYINKTKPKTKESFVNYKYIDHKQRGLRHFKFTSLIE